MDTRENTILAVLRESGFARVPALAERLEISESTVRRLLRRLEREGKVGRAWGGAVPVAPVESSPPVGAFAERQQVALAEKVAIARVAAGLIQDGDTVFLGGGSTVGQMPRFLRGRPLQVVTNSLAIAAQLEDCAVTEVLITGGYLFPRHQLLSGPVTVAQLRDLHFTWAFVGGGGFTVQEVTDWNVMMAEVNREALRRAEYGVALLDFHKFNRRHLARVCGLSELAYLISSPLPAASEKVIEAAGPQFLAAEQDSAAGEPGHSASSLHPNGSYAANGTAARRKIREVPNGKPHPTPDSRQGETSDAT